MSVNEVLQSLGSWDITLRADVPRDVLDAIDHLGHIAVVSGRLDPRQYGDGLLDGARYVGVLLGRDTSSDTKLSGAGMTWWLGDADDKGAVIETAINLTSVTFANAIRSLLPVAVHEGTLHSVAGTYTRRHQWETPRKAIEYVCESFSSGGLGATTAVEYRINGDATLDAGTVAQLYVTTPTCLITAIGAGHDHTLQGLPGTFGVRRDVEDFTTRVVLMGEGEGLTLVTESADISSNPYKDRWGNPVKLTRVVSESSTPLSAAAARAAVHLAEFSGTQDDLSLSTRDYDIAAMPGAAGGWQVGDFVWVWDPDSGLVDAANEVTFRGQRLNPIKLRITEATWPVTEGMTVAYRDKNGTWYDLTDYVQFESGDTSLKVGAFSRQLTSSGFEPVGTRPAVDTTVPAAPTLVTPFAGSVYLDGQGFSRAQLRVTWTAPLNTDGSTILDGDHYEVRYAVDADVTYPATWAQIAGRQWNQLHTWAQPNAFPSGDWNIAYAAWASTSVLIQDLSPGVGYDFQIRAVDKSGNFSAWSPTTTAVATPDNIPPSTPAAPEVAASRIALQVVHRLGKAGGGTFNLEADLDHLEVHVDVEPTFLPADATRVGRLRASAGLIQAQIPAVGTFQVETTATAWVKVVAVDINGNKSLPSAAASSTALLIDNAHISDLTVSKVTAGTIGADWIVGARIKTADNGARVELNASGIQAYNAAGTQTVNIASSDGTVSIIGQLAGGVTGQRIVVNPTGADQPQIRFYPVGDDTTHARISAYSASGPTNADITMESGKDPSLVKSASIMQETVWSVGRYDDAYVHRGGHVSGSNASARVGFENASVDNYMQFGSDGKVFHLGRWDDFVDRGSGTGIFSGHVDVTTNALTITYGTTAASIRYPVCQHNDTRAIGSISTMQVNTVGTASFDVEINAFNTEWRVYFWAFRV